MNTSWPQADRAGVALARAYWCRVVRPLLDQALPDVPRAAARIGSGSDVLGLDDATSRDHDWGLRLQVFVPPEHVGAVAELLAARLPADFAGHPARLVFTGRPDAQLAVDVGTLDELIATGLGFDPRLGGTVADWLSLTGQSVLEVSAGEVFEDTDGQLTALRTALAWYPDDIWRYVVASGWQRIDQELPIMGRAGDRGDELGSLVIAARLVDVAVHLGFLLCRRWAPYSKWRGTLFARLPLPAELGQSLRGVLREEHWQARGERLAAALAVLAEVQLAAGLPAPATPCVPFWDRPYLHLDPALVPGVMAGAESPEVRALPVGLGSIEQRSDNVDLLVHTDQRRAAVGLGRTSGARGTGPIP